MKTSTTLLEIVLGVVLALLIFSLICAVISIFVYAAYGFFRIGFPTAPFISLTSCFFFTAAFFLLRSILFAKFTVNKK